MGKNFFAALGRFKTPGLAHLFVSFFLFISCVNFLGLFPYIFTSSSHLRITVRVALPLWLGYIIYSTVYNINFFLSHLVPLGTPVALIPLMVIIECQKTNSPNYPICTVGGQYSGRAPFNSSY